MCIRLMKNSKVPMLSKKGYLVYNRRWLRKCWVSYTFCFSLIQAGDIRNLEQITDQIWIKWRCTYINIQRARWFSNNPIPPNMDYIWLNILQLLWYLEERFYMFNIYCTWPVSYYTCISICQHIGHLVIFAMMNLNASIFMVFKCSISPKHFISDFKFV